MSDKGWRAFLAASGIEEWVVLHGGPTAVYRTTSLADKVCIAAWPDGAVDPSEERAD